VSIYGAPAEAPTASDRAPGLSFWERGRASLARLLGVDLTHSQKRYALVLENYAHPGCRWLDVGCGRQVVPDWAMPFTRQQELVSSVEMLVGMDIDDALYEHPLLTYRVKGLGDPMPFRSGSFDLVTANMVIEHVQHPHQFLMEIQRILQPGGRFIFHTPNFHNVVVCIGHFVPDSIKQKLIWVLEKRRAEDIFPTRFELNTVARIRKVVAGTSLTIERLGINGTSGAFAVLGPIGWAEVLMMKAVAVVTGQYNSNLICVLRRD
jgi:2-polyprenyl-3-methyl-5-hydroxy-6-metoxy-1,4-benzoquinol methylase